ncbi:unnamed protein product [Camellia sinensis]
MLDEPTFTSFSQLEMVMSLNCQKESDGNPKNSIDDKKMYKRKDYINKDGVQRATQKTITIPTKLAPQSLTDHMLAQPEVGERTTSKQGQHQKKSSRTEFLCLKPTGLIPTQGNNAPPKHNLI